MIQCSNKLFLGLYFPDVGSDDDKAFRPFGRGTFKSRKSGSSHA